MPVILPEQHHAAWLGETEDGNLKALLVPYPADQMRMWEISPRINRGAESEGSGDPIQSRDSRALARCPAVGINPLLGCAHETESIPLTEYFPFRELTPVSPLKVPT